MKGLTPTEAANLTAWICGLSTSDPRWSLKQINQLLFLRAMRQSGRFGGLLRGTVVRRGKVKEEEVGILQRARTPAEVMKILKRQARQAPKDRNKKKRR